MRSVKTIIDNTSSINYVQILTKYKQQFINL